MERQALVHDAGGDSNIVISAMIDVLDDERLIRRITNE
jgi:hypothetical protein